MWGTHEGFMEVVRSSWCRPMEGCAMKRVSKKLKWLKKYLQKWNVEAFGRVEGEIKAIETRLGELEQVVVSNYSQEM